jgi:hypothetical protein
MSLTDGESRHVLICSRACAGEAPGVKIRGLVVMLRNSWRHGQGMAHAAGDMARSLRTLAALTMSEILDLFQKSVVDFDGCLHSPTLGDP